MPTQERVVGVLDWPHIHMPPAARDAREGARFSYVYAVALYETGQREPALTQHRPST
jgi:hypothetical protein